MIEQARQILKSTFGYDGFRSLQKEVIQNVLNKHDTLVIMPTGSGKSLCYQIPALLFHGMTVVVSPLISLMEDQVAQLNTVGVPAICLNSSLSQEVYYENMKRLLARQVKLLYVAPETLLLPRMLELLTNQGIACLTIDEAHCISEWGHDFRPEYRQLLEVRRQFPDAVCIALTATATPRVQKEIKNTLSFGKSNEFIASFDRPNLFLRVVEKRNPLEQTLEFVKEFPDKSGIIYCFSRQQVDDLAMALASQGLSVRPYHAGMSDESRRRNQELFIKDDVQIMVATIAFGMGINKPNVRYVVHYDLPKNIESYYQQIGRAGRDGLRSECLLLFGYGDMQKIRYILNEKEGQERKIATQHLDAMVRFCESETCRRSLLLHYFGERYPRENCGACDTCLHGPADLDDVTVAAQKFLSCVKRTGERFGVHYIIDVLRGTNSERIFQNGHQQLSTYGVGADTTKKRWLELSRHFIRKELVRRDPLHSGLALTENARPVLKGEEKVLARLRKTDEPVRLAEAESAEHDTELFEYLRKRRKRLADAEQVPPYVVFQDRTLVEMASYFPQTRENLKKLYGVGDARLEKYGMRFLNDIYGYCKRKGIPDQTERLTGHSATRSSSKKTAKTPKTLIIGQAFNEGASIETLSEKHRVQYRTIVNHLLNFLQSGQSFEKQREDYLLSLVKLSDAEKSAVLKKFELFGTERLKPVFDDFQQQISYENLDLLRLVYLCSTAKKQAPGAD